MSSNNSIIRYFIKGMTGQGIPCLLLPDKITRKITTRVSTVQMKVHETAATLSHLQRMRKRKFREKFHPFSAVFV